MNNIDAINQIHERINSFLSEIRYGEKVACFELIQLLNIMRALTEEVRRIESELHPVQ